MSLVFDQRNSLGDNPGLHALVVGVSDYSHLPDRQADPGPPHFGMARLHSTALTAFRMYEWLRERHDAGSFPVPLATVRLLLSPSSEEEQAVPEIAGSGADPATLDNFLHAAAGWRSDACAHPEGTTIFYFAGHGVQRNEEDAIMIFQEFGSGVGGALRESVDVDNIYYGMVPTPPDTPQHDIARTQFYFVDACRNVPDEIGLYGGLNPTDVFTTQIGGRDDRKAPAFYATIPGAKAYALRGEQTVFSRALLRCLDVAADEPDEDGRWPVTAWTLNRVLRQHFDAMDPYERAGQQYSVGRFDDAVIQYLDEPPPVDISVTVTPEEALQTAELNVLDQRGRPKEQIPTPLPEHPYHLSLGAGLYSLEANITSGSSPYVSSRSLQTALPLSKSWRLNIDRR